MVQPIVILPDPAPSSDFAAGVATAVAAEATETAEAAETAAAIAQADADVARERATAAEVAGESAEVRASLAHARLDELETAFDDLVEDVVRVLNGETDPAEVAELVDDGAPPPVPTDAATPDPEPATKDETEPKRARRSHSGRFGADSWFGKRD